MNERALALVETLGLEPHPEGGWYREVFASGRQVVPDGGRPARRALTAIYFLLAGGQWSRWHRLLSDEVWSHLEGEPLQLLVLDPATGQLERPVLGPSGPGRQPIVTIPAGAWQAAVPLGGFALAGCFVGPGFDFQDFAFAADDTETVELIRRLGGGLDRYL